MTSRHSVNKDSILGKICSKCGYWYSLNNFARDSGQKDGMNCICRSCYSIYDKGKYQTRKILLTRLKSNGCAICGYDKCCNALDFHHVLPEDKKFQINAVNFSKYSSNKLVDELNKCILLCCICHREIEYTGVHQII